MGKVTIIIEDPNRTSKELEEIGHEMFDLLDNYGTVLGEEVGKYVVPSEEE